MLLRFTSILLVFAAACVTGGPGKPETSFLAANPSPRQLSQRSAHDVQVFVNERPKAEYVELGVIQSQGGSSEEAYQAMRDRAGELGCDGLIYGGSDDKVEGHSGQYSGEVYTVPGHRATCIVYRDASAAPPPTTTAAARTSYTADCAGPIEEWQSESDFGKKTLLYRDLDPDCRAQVEKR